MRGSKPVTLATAIISIIAIGVLFCVVQASSNQPASRPDRSTSSQPATQPTTQAATQPTSQPAKPQVVVETSMGRIVLELDTERTPNTTANFLRYVDDKFYDGVIFHRVMKTFMIQAGGFSAGSRPKRPTHPPVRNESQGAAGNKRYTIAMARTGDPHSATSQFFINTADNQQLDYSGGHGGYCVFGRVIEGMDVVDQIAAVQVQASPISAAQPLRDVIITSARRK